MKFSASIRETEGKNMIDGWTGWSIGINGLWQYRHEKGNQKR